MATMNSWTANARRREERLENRSSKQRQSDLRPKRNTSSPVRERSIIDMRSIGILGDGFFRNLPSGVPPQHISPPLASTREEQPRQSLAALDGAAGDETGYMND
jgi:hypothetical protein